MTYNQGTAEFRLVNFPCGITDLNINQQCIDTRLQDIMVVN